MKPYETGICDEIWADIKDFPEYQISNFGKVRSLRRKIPTILRGHFNSHGFLDSGTSHLRDKAEVMFEALKKIANEKYPTYVATLQTIAQEAINEALKR